MPAAKVYDTAISSIGVECFLFLSGMGLYFSMSKNRSIGRFYSKRMSRVLLPYAVWGFLFWFVLDIFIKGEDLLSFLYDYSSLSFWLDGDRTLWYVPFIVLLYLAFPVLYRLFGGKYPLIKLCALVIICICVAAALKVLAPNVYENTEIAVNRVPIFLLGTYYGRRIYENDRFRLTDALLVLGGVSVHIFGILQRSGIIPFDFSISRYEFSLFAFPLILFCAWIMSKVKMTIIKRFLCKAGALSLELYMTHVSLDSLLRFCHIPTYKAEIYIIIIIFSIIFSILLHFLIKNIIIRVSR